MCVSRDVKRDKAFRTRRTLRSAFLRPFTEEALMGSRKAMVVKFMNEEM